MTPLAVRILIAPAYGLNAPANAGELAQAGEPARASEPAHAGKPAYAGIRLTCAGIHRCTAHTKFEVNISIQYRVMAQNRFRLYMAVSRPY